MFVKKITISGFKSYREVSIAGPFEQGHNVIVGRNGSGKSNFFDAVRFVLSDTYSSLRSEERLALLHEGSGASLLSAYVEIVFDNSDGRLPFEKDDVSLRRMIGLKKDEYVLDRKNVSRSEVFNVLEAAGFSRSNPYYIVQQGKVSSLVAMTDAQRLDLLREVAGTRVYDERRRESLKLMDETEGKRTKINEVVQYIEDRLQELESEKEELKEFQVLDKERRAIEYTIYVQELEEAKQKLEQLEEDRTEEHEKNLELYQRQKENEGEINNNEKAENALKGELKQLRADFQAAESSHRQGLEAAAKLRVDVQEAQDAVRAGRARRVEAEEKLGDLRRRIEERRHELEPIRPLLEAAKLEEEDAQNRLNACEKGILDLRVKAGRGSQFRTQEERDAAIREKLAERTRLLEDAKTQAEVIRTESTSIESTLERTREEISAKHSAHDEKRSSVESIGAELVELRARRDELQTRKQELWRKDAEVSSKMRDLAGDLDQHERTLRAGIGGGTFSAISAVEEAAKDDEAIRQGYYGPLYEVIRVSARFAVAADTAAGSALTFVVVDTDETAAKLVGVLQRKKAGRVTFIPLNRLDAEQRGPLPASQDAIPLISKVECDDVVRPAVQQILGGVMIARSVSVASVLAKQHNIDCVTLDGDLVNRRGAMTGGFVDARKSRVEAASAVRSVKDQIKTLDEELQTVRVAIDQTETELSNLLALIETKHSAMRSTQAQVKQLVEDRETLEEEVISHKKNLDSVRQRLTTLRDSIGESEAEVAELEGELNSPLRASLSSEEEQELARLVEDVQPLRDEVTAKTRERSRLQVQVDKIVDDIESNLQKREGDLERGLRTEPGPEEDEPLGQAAASTQEVDLERAEAEAAHAQSEIDRIDAETRDAESGLKEIEVALEDLRAEEAKLAELVEKGQEKMESLFNRRALLILKKDELEKKIRELGSLPQDFERHRGATSEALVRSLKHTNERLKNYSHVNKKALNQYLNFSEQRDSLQKRRQELDEGAEAINQLIESLDNRKDEDILRTFKAVSKHFADVFAELVPGGRASLVMHRGGGGESQRISYIGVSMKIAFAAGGETFVLNQLSGGQKSIVALTFIFAIQRLDPAPFYLFDEIDANLDGTHRQAVANLIKRQVQRLKTQFITTTFRPEFVNTADKVFGVVHRNKVSSISEIGRDEALNFVTDAPQP